jgi:flagellar hook assembly protein FlgD
LLEVQLAGSSAITKFELPHETGILEVGVFDIRGRSMRKMFVGLQGDRTSISWDGKNEHGQAVASGIYEVRISAGGHFDAGKIMVE